MLDINVINALEKDGWKRWTKGDYDRLYFNINHTDYMAVTYHKSGWVASATLDGEEISNSQASRIMGVKCWIDVETGKLYVRYGRDDAQETVKKYAEKSLEEAQQAQSANDDAFDHIPEEKAEHKRNHLPNHCSKESEFKK